MLPKPPKPKPPPEVPYKKDEEVEATMQFTVEQHKAVLTALECHLATVKEAYQIVLEAFNDVSDP
jgi:hypothetical protein